MHLCVRKHSLLFSQLNSVIFFFFFVLVKIKGLSLWKALDLVFVHLGYLMYWMSGTVTRECANL